MKKLEDFAIKPIEEAIAQHKSDCFVINQNYEIVIPDTQKSLLHPNYFDVPTVQKIFDKFYEDSSQFFPNELEIDSLIFTHRLNALSTFFKKIGEDAKPIKKIVTAIYRIEGSLKIEPMTLRLFDDMRSPIVSRTMHIPAVRKILGGFCQQREMEKKELLYLLEQL